jgi:polar amino acid transport system substrate-binding protein
VGVLARANAALRDSVDAVLREAMRDGTLEQIFRRWSVWDESQGALFDRVVRSTAAAAPPGTAAGSQALAYLPSLARAAGVTALISVLSMMLAVIVGLALASARVYGPVWLRVATTVYVEVIRGTPLLLQLFVIYYGLAGVVRLPAFLAAVLALGLNYGAYEAEIYRGALEAVPRLQLEAARTLGFSEWQILRLVRGPQALRFALAPMTNDFVALLKDSALVSVITVVELTKQTAIYATNVGSWVVPGALCALVYLAMSLPLARLARRLERRWRPA